MTMRLDGDRGLAPVFRNPLPVTFGHYSDGPRGQHRGERHAPE